MKTSWFSILQSNVFEFGEQKVTQFVVFECKYLFSIIVFYFHKSDGVQDRYHTHAFNAISIKLWGRYTEYTCNENRWGVGGWGNNLRKEIIRYIPKNCFHKIGNGTGCCTILISGPWEREWKEFKDDKVTLYTWGRVTK